MTAPSRIRSLATFQLHGPLALLTPLLLCGALAAQHWRVIGQPAPRVLHALAYDFGRGCTVLFGGDTTDTWEFDGARWRNVVTSRAPVARSYHALVFDPRGRTVLYGGVASLTTLADTWEYDGTNWTQVVTAQSPGMRAGHAMAFDLVRNRTVLFGGWSATALAADTWEYDGTNWTQRSTASSPSARSTHAMAFDLARARTVLHGGVDSSVAVLADTWEYDGANWTAVATAASPPRRNDPRLAYDLLRNRTVLFGGGSDTWEYDGSNWVQVPVPVAPPAVENHALAFDAARGRTVLYGGAGINAGQMFGDTWTYDGTTWSLVSEVPSVRYGAAVAHDSQRGRMILFGGSLPLPPGWGCAGNCPLVVAGDTWESHGGSWRRMAPAVAPPARYGGATGYDSRRHRTVMFGGRVPGGRGGGGFQVNDTWEYDGATWSQVHTEVLPPAGLGQLLSFDSARARMVMFGGGAAETWEYDGVNWIRVATTTAPPARTGHGLAFAAARQRTVLFGGAAGASTVFADTWEYDGSNWTQLPTAVAPPARTGHLMTWDPVRGCVVLVGGSNSNLSMAYADTWELTGTVWTQSTASPTTGFGAALTFDPDRGRAVLFDGGMAELVEAAAPTWARHGRGCAGSVGTPSLDRAASAVPVLGSSFPLQFSNLPAAPGGLVLTFGLGIARWNGLALPVDLGPFGLQGCELWIEPASSLLVTHPGTARTFPLAIPANPVLAGLLVAVQALVFDAAAANGTGPLTNAGVMRLY